MSDCSTNAFKVPEEPELRECPFCGSIPLVVDTAPELFITCLNPKCLLHSTFNHTKEGREKAIEAWNTRYQPTCTYDVTHHKTIAGKDIAVATCSNCGSQIFYCEEPPNGHCSGCGNKIVEKVD